MYSSQAIASASPLLHISIPVLGVQRFGLAAITVFGRHRNPDVLDSIWIPMAMRQFWKSG
jgi:hypothetical protein